MCEVWPSISEGGKVNVSERKLYACGFMRVYRGAEGEVWRRGSEVVITDKDGLVVFPSSVVLYRRVRRGFRRIGGC